MTTGPEAEQPHEAAHIEYIGEEQWGLLVADWRERHPIEGVDIERPDLQDVARAMLPPDSAGEKSPVIPLNVNPRGFFDEEERAPILVGARFRAIAVHDSNRASFTLMVNIHGENYRIEADSQGPYGTYKTKLDPTPKELYTRL